MDGAQSVPLCDFQPEVIGSHADMWTAPLDRDLALIYPPWCDSKTVRHLLSLGCRLIEADRIEQEPVAPVNLITIHSCRVLMSLGAPRNRALFERQGVDVTEMDYSEMIKDGGGIRTTTMQLLRDPGPRHFA